jgi:hypothetical protein
MKEGIQTNYPDERVKKYGCAFLCLCQLLKPELEDIPGGLIEKIPDEFLDKREMYVKDWLNLYNFLNGYLNAKKDVLVGIPMEAGKTMISKNIKADGTTTHFTLMRDGGTVFDPLDPGRAAAKAYVKHILYDFV